MAVGGPLVRRVWARGQLGALGIMADGSGFGLGAPPHEKQNIQLLLEGLKVGIEEAFASTEVSALPAWQFALEQISTPITRFWAPGGSLK
jgi:hypothetical protein